jgi:hypothetical protein
MTMSDSRDRVQAYSFDLNATPSVAAVRLGWHRFKAIVTEYSWSGYTIIVSPSIARKMQKGKHGTLEFQGSNYKVCCLESQQIDKTSTKVQLLLDASESAPQIPKKKKRCAASTTLNLSQRDPIFGVAAGFGIVIVLAMLPGWGDGWGTSSYVSEGFRAIFMSVYDVCIGLLGG